MENKVPDGSKNHINRNHGTIIVFLSWDRKATCLLSGPRFDEGGGNFTGGNGRWIMYSHR